MPPRSRKLAGLAAIAACALLTAFAVIVAFDAPAQTAPKAIPSGSIIERDAAGEPLFDRSRPVPAREEILAAWQRRQSQVHSFRFAWTEQQVHPRGWVPNPRYPEREWVSIPNLHQDRTYTVTKALAVDGERMRYSFELNRPEETGDTGLGVARRYRYVSTFDGRAGAATLTSLQPSMPPPSTVLRSSAHADAQTLDTRAILLALRPLDPALGHLRTDRAIPNGARTFFRGRSGFLFEERADPSGWKTVLVVEPERDFIVSRIALLFEQKIIADVEIDFRQDQQAGWVPSAWRVTEMLADGSRRLVSTATVTSYEINRPIADDQFR